jgi:hypothetical protein
MKWLRLTVVVVCGFAIAPSALALGNNLSDFPMQTLQQLVGDLYNQALTFVGLCVFVMYLYAGMSYIIPKSIQPKSMGDPWTIIQDATIGLVLLFSAYLILNTINPDLVGNSSSSAPQTQPLTP